MAFGLGSLTLTQPCLFHRSPKPASHINPVLMYFYRYAQLRLETRTGRIKIDISDFLRFAVFSFGDGLFKQFQIV